MNARTAGIVARCDRKLDIIQDWLDKQPRAACPTVKAIQAAIEENRPSVSPTFDAIESFLLLEVERLQPKNFWDEELQHSPRTYVTL